VEIKCIAAESFGARSMACVVKTRSQKIVIDPGIALDRGRFQLLPHPFQIVAARVLRINIIHELKDATDVVITHFHGDHHPMVNADIYQLDASNIIPFLQKVNIYCKSEEKISSTAKKRRKQLEHLLKKKFNIFEGKIEGNLHFSPPMAHGEIQQSKNTVMMVGITEGSNRFLFGSDIQMLNSASINWILDFKPTIAYIAGPPLYISSVRKKFESFAWNQAVKLAKNIPTLIIDHHLLRFLEGFDFIDRLDKNSSGRVLSAADFMGYKRVPLEALRKELYQEMPVSLNWHRNYEMGTESIEVIQKWRNYSIDSFPPKKA